MLSPFDELSLMPGAAGDVERERLVDPPLPYESPADTALRQQTAAKEGARAFAASQRIKAGDLARNQFASYTDPSGTVSAVTDETGAPITNYNKRANVGWDSMGNPVQVNVTPDGPKVEDAYSGRAPITDKRGDQYLRHPYLPDKWIGEDSAVKADRMAQDQDKAVAQASSALGRKLSLAERQMHRDAVEFKHRDKDFASNFGPIDYDNPDDSRKALEASLNEEYKADDANKKSGWFGIGSEFTPEAMKRRAEIDQKKATALQNFDRLIQTRQTLAQRRAKADQIERVRDGLETQRADYALGKARASGVIPGLNNEVGDQSDDAAFRAANPLESPVAATPSSVGQAVGRPSESAATAGPSIQQQLESSSTQKASTSSAQSSVIPGLDQPEPQKKSEPAEHLAAAAAGQKPYRYDETNGIQFTPDKLSEGLEQASKDGVVDPEWAKQHAEAFKTAQAKYQELQEAAGGAQVVKALLHGGGMGAAFMAGYGAGSPVGASIGGGIGTLVGGLAGAPTVVGEAATIPAGATLGAGIGSVLGGLSAGTLAAFAARKGLEKLGEYSDAIKSLNASAELHPIADAAGELVAFGASAPKAIGNLARLGSIAKAGAIGEGATEAAGTLAGARAIGGQLAKGAVAGAAFEGIARPAFDATRYMVADQLGIPHDELQSPTADSLATNVALGVLTAGHSLQFRDYNSADLASILTRAKVRSDAGIPLDADAPMADMVAAYKAKGVDLASDNAAAMTKPLTPEEIALRESLAKQTKAMEGAGAFKDAGVKFESATQAVIPTLKKGEGKQISSAVIKAEPNGESEGAIPGLGEPPTGTPARPKAPTPAPPTGEPAPEAATPTPEPPAQPSVESSTASAESAATERPAQDLATQRAEVVGALKSASPMEAAFLKAELAKLDNQIFQSAGTEPAAQPDAGTGDAGKAALASSTLSASEQAPPGSSGAHLSETPAAALPPKLSRTETHPEAGQGLPVLPESDASPRTPAPSAESGANQSSEAAPRTSESTPSLPAKGDASKSQEIQRESVQPSTQPAASEAPKQARTQYSGVVGKPINTRRTALNNSLGVPREEMPQVAAEHRGALANFLEGRGIKWKNEEVAPSTLKPSQADFTPGKVEKAREWSGESDRRILISSDNRVIDGHHQWLARLKDHPDEPMPVIRLAAPASEILEQIHEFPSAGMEKPLEIDAPPKESPELTKSVIPGIEPKPAESPELTKLRDKLVDVRSEIQAAKDAQASGFGDEDTEAEIASLERVAGKMVTQIAKLENAAPDSLQLTEPEARSVNQSSRESASWVIRDKATGEPIRETDQRSVAEKVNTKKYEAVPVARHLHELNDPSTLAYQWAHRNAAENVSHEAPTERTVPEPPNENRPTGSEPESQPADSIHAGGSGRPAGEGDSVPQTGNGGTARQPRGQDGPRVRGSVPGGSDEVAQTESELKKRIAKAHAASGAPVTFEPRAEGEPEAGMNPNTGKVNYDLARTAERERAIDERGGDGKAHSAAVMREEDLHGRGFIANAAAGLMSGEMQKRIADWSPQDLTIAMLETYGELMTDGHRGTELEARFAMVMNGEQIAEELLPGREEAAKRLVEIIKRTPLPKWLTRHLATMERVKGGKVEPKAKKAPLPKASASPSKHPEIQAAIERNARAKEAYDKLVKMHGGPGYLAANTYSGSRESQVYRELSNAGSDLRKAVQSAGIQLPPVWGDFVSHNREGQDFDTLRSVDDLAHALADAWASQNRNIELSKISGLATGGAFIDGVSPKNIREASQELFNRYKKEGLAAFVKIQEQFAEAQKRDAAILRERFPENEQKKGEPESFGAAKLAPQPKPVLTPAETSTLATGYGEIVRRTGFPAVSIGRLAADTGIPLDKLKDHLRAEWKAGRVVLSKGDWSLSNERTRAGAIEVNGERMLQVRWLPESKLAGGQGEPQAADMPHKNAAAHDSADASKSSSREASRLFPEANRLTNLSKTGATWAKIVAENPALKNAGETVTAYRAAIGKELRHDDFVALNRAVAEDHLESLKDRGEIGEITTHQVRVADLLMANDATEFVYAPRPESSAPEGGAQKSYGSAKLPPKPPVGNPTKEAADRITGAPEGRKSTGADARAAAAAHKSGAVVGRFANAIDAAKAAARSVGDYFTKLEEVGTYRKAKGEWLGAGKDAATGANGRQVAAIEARRMRDAIFKKFPNKLSRQAVSRYIEADGDTAALTAQAAASKPALKAVYNRALDLTPEEKQLAAEAKRFFDEIGKQGQEFGILNDMLENYVTHFVDRSSIPVKDQASTVAGVMSKMSGAKLKTRFDQALKRVMSSMFELEQKGYRLASSDIGEIMAAYSQAFSNTVADRAFIKSLTTLGAHDGRPLAVTSGYAKTMPDEEGNGPLMVKANTKPEHSRDYVPINHPALRKWKWATKTLEGREVFVEGEILVHPSIAQDLRNTLGTSSLNKVPLVRAVTTLQYEAKSLMLGLSLFHYVQEGVHAIGHRVNPLKLHRIDTEDPIVRELMNGGLMLASWDAKRAFSEGLSSSGIIGKIPGIGRFNDEVTAFLFEQYIPGLKVAMAKDAFERNLKKFKGELASGKITREQVAQKTAQQANDAFGEQNNAYLGNNPTRIHAERLGFLAPDFLKSRAKFFADAFRKYGTEQRRALIFLALVMMVTAKALERLMTGENKWEKPFSVVTPTREYELRSVPGDVLELLQDPRRFVSGRLSPLISRPTLEGITGRDWRGRKRTFGEQLMDLIKTPIPISIRGLVDKDAPELSPVEQIGSATGFRAKRHSEITQARILGHEWQKKMGLENTDEVYPQSKYLTLRNALEDGNDERARKAYAELLKTADKEHVGRGFEESLMKPFSGSEKNEAKFRASLHGDDLKAYKAGLASQERVRRAFERIAGYHPKGERKLPVFTGFN
jgi:hypothetical protein